MPNQPPPQKPRSLFGSLGTFGTLAIAIGVGVIGFYALEWHRHTCESCGRKWSHLGALNQNCEGSHTCTCGQVQWWKDGAPHVLRGSQYVMPERLPSESPSESAALPPPPQVVASAPLLRASSRKVLLP